MDRPSLLHGVRALGPTVCVGGGAATAPKIEMWPGWRTSPARWRLLWATLAGLVLPWLLGEWVKSAYQPGLTDQPERSQMLVDFIVAGSILFALTMVLTYAIGCWITAVMHGPRRDGDVFPAGQGQPQHDD